MRVNEIRVKQIRVKQGLGVCEQIEIPCLLMVLLSIVLNKLPCGGWLSGCDNFFRNFVNIVNIIEIIFIVVIIVIAQKWH